MNVKNNSKVPIAIGHITVIPGGVANIDETLLYQPRVQALKANGDLAFPFVAEVVPAAPVEQPKPKVVLNLKTEVKSPETVLVVSPKNEETKVEDKPRGKRK
jgi:hypothetical protein